VRSPDGTVARTSGDVVLVRRADGTRLVLRGHKDRVTSVAFSEDGTRIVTASRDHDPRVWDAVTGEQQLLLKGHFGTVSDARFSPDGRWIVTAGPITAGLWSARTGALVRYLRGPESQLVAAAFTGADEIVTLEADGTVRTATCSLCVAIPGLLRLADTRLAQTGRALSDEERARYLPNG
jgi:WD40 repeat protein